MTSFSDLTKVVDLQKADWLERELTKSDLKESSLNPNISRTSLDILYHLGLDNKSYDLQEMFSDVKFVCMGGSAKRMEIFANLCVKHGLAGKMPVGQTLCPIGKTERYSLFKVGPVLSVNHGMGMASMSILLHELVKLLYYAKATNFIFIRIGTSGGLGLDPGTIVVAKEGVDSIKFENFYTVKNVGKKSKYPCIFPDSLVQELLAVSAKELPHIKCVTGKTMSTDDFYEEQGRLDGAVCDYKLEDQQEWLRRAHEAGVKNIEMEGLMFGSFCARVGVPAILCNTTLLDRLKGDQVSSTPEELAQMSANAQTVALTFILYKLKKEEDSD
eukprot:CAMPEP_0201488146 /NCGR_PEP_ID=MMETSP0151_2-20130828/17240_1 /ASSEMBLY_ACC=CAM_ASM_000257 /TAXON_ID=200890 /ORGANISM="Paramoeba atlantica, Strain 621/1 / CCAP 1560/9" /LENGTH=328 /DNA_ID=CAMNT_0047873379 /DNA_START=27 /DNA_END=1013 /DNA_ORIENTATION=-